MHVTACVVTRQQHQGAPQDTRGFIYLLTFIMGIGVRRPQLS